MSNGLWDVVIVGGGPAGLSAALLLGRCRRHVLVCDAGTPRNAKASALHGYLTRDGIDPWELRRAGRRELARYGVECRDERVTDARRGQDTFDVDLSATGTVTTRKLLLATGVADRVPAQPGFAECFGKTVHHCPYCDGWESRDRRLALYARGRRSAGAALALLDWSADVLLCTDGPSRLTRDDRSRLGEHRVRVREERVVRLDQSDGRLDAVVFDGGPPEPRDHLFFDTGQVPQSDLAHRLGCEFTRTGAVVTDRHEQTCVSGLYVVGDASRDVQLAIVAAAEGARAAFAINSSFQRDRLGRAG